jgi:WhiB family redox-sensing transcriptional regulator
VTDQLADFDAAQEVTAMPKSRSTHLDPIHARATPPVAAEPDRACAGADPEIFFPKVVTHTAKAFAICGRCLHRQACLDWALETRQAHGIWGGTSADERAHMLRGAA